MDIYLDLIDFNIDHSLNFDIYISNSFVFVLDESSVTVLTDNLNIIFEKKIKDPLLCTIFKNKIIIINKDLELFVYSFSGDFLNIFTIYSILKGFDASTILNFDVFDNKLILFTDKNILYIDIVEDRIFFKNIFVGEINSINKKDIGDSDNYFIVNDSFYIFKELPNYTYNNKNLGAYLKFYNNVFTYNFNQVEILTCDANSFVISKHIYNFDIIYDDSKLFLYDGLSLYTLDNNFDTNSDFIIETKDILLKYGYNFYCNKLSFDIDNLQNIDCYFLYDGEYFKSKRETHHFIFSKKLKNKLKLKIKGKLYNQINTLKIFGIPSLYRRY